MLPASKIYSHCPIRLVRTCKLFSRSSRKNQPLLRASASDQRRLVVVDAEDRLTVPVTKVHDEGAPISAYMALPVSQFVLIDVPLGGQLHRIGSDLFELVVPRLELFGLWVQPDIKCIVRNDPEKVDIESIALQIQGSDLIRTLRINERVDFSVTCRFTHTDHTKGGSPAIHSHAKIHALVDPPAPFSFMSDFVLSATASKVLEASLSALLGTFVRSLAEDYAKWASNHHYREQRRQYADESDSDSDLALVQPAD